MDYQLISDINFAESVDSRVFGIFLAKEVSVLPQKNGQQYLSITMKCKDCEINAKLFGVSQDQIDTVKGGKVYNAAIDVKPYAKSPTGWSCNIYNIEENTELDSAAFIEWSDWMNKASDVVNSTLQFVSTGVYKDIVYPLMAENWSKFAGWAAASSVHHNSLGGLIVHTAEVIEQCNILADMWNSRYGYDIVDKQLLLSAALLHDLGKTRELSVDMASGNADYSTEGSLQSHIMIGLSMIDIQAYKVGFGIKVDGSDKSDETVKNEQEKLMLLKHCLAAHHGRLEWGSPVTPGVPEASILSHADCMSAEMFRYNKNFKGMQSGTSSHNWISGTLEVYYKESGKNN